MLSFGCDPEFFFATKVRGKDFVVSPALLNRFSGLDFYGDDEKHPIFYEDNLFKWMMDGVAAEITIKKPYQNPIELFSVLKNALEVLDEISSKLEFLGNQIFVVRKPVINIKKDWYLPYLNDTKIYQGFIYGCDPDFDADDEKYTCSTKDARKDDFRYGGGHHHVSGDKNLFEYILPAIKLSAIFVGTFCILNSPYPELEIQRGQVYGRPARFRPQRYSNGESGMEYRTPSNSWVSFSKEKIVEMFSKYNTISRLLENESLAVEILNTFYSRSAKAIVNADKIECENIQNEVKSI